MQNDNGVTCKLHRFYLHIFNIHLSNFSIILNTVEYACSKVLRIMYRKGKYHLCTFNSSGLRSAFSKLQHAMQATLE